MLVKNVREKERKSLDEKIVINKMQVVWLWLIYIKNSRRPTSDPFGTLD